MWPEANQSSMDERTWNPAWTKTCSEQISWEVESLLTPPEGPRSGWAELNGWWINPETPPPSGYPWGLLSAHSIIHLSLLPKPLYSRGVEPCLTATLIIKKSLWLSETEAVITNNYLLSTILFFAVAFNQELWLQNWPACGFQAPCLIRPLLHLEPLSICLLDPSSTSPFQLFHTCHTGPLSIHPTCQTPSCLSAFLLLGPLFLLAQLTSLYSAFGFLFSDHTLGARSLLRSSWTTFGPPVLGSHSTRYVASAALIPTENWVISCVIAAHCCLHHETLYCIKAGTGSLLFYSVIPVLSAVPTDKYSWTLVTQIRK